MMNLSFCLPLGSSQSRASSLEGMKGCRIITADSGGGMLDVLDRRPVVFGANDARVWLSDVSSEVADQLLQESALPVAEFTWFAVGRAVGNVRNEGAELIDPLG
ncbi:SOS response-associated peptidase family protein [Pseudomonas sp. CBC3]|uniref:SOS response-associated peptidase family protein n=1 Tax=Pseudomonas sp. CBC3 TaxID=3123318 RepID=UPI004040C76D